MYRHTALGGHKSACRRKHNIYPKESTNATTGNKQEKSTKRKRQKSQTNRARKRIKLYQQRN